MNFWKHLEELRTRLLRAAIGTAIGTVIGLIFVEPVFKFVVAPMKDVQPVALHPTESIVVYFRLGVLLGLVLAMPYILWQILGFVLPGLEKAEKRFLLFSVFGIGFFFAAGVIFAGWVMIPLTIGYLRTFMADLVQPTYSIDGYMSFITTILFSSGIVFETPLVLALLARFGVVNARQLARGRRFALVLFAVLAAVITPTPDAFNMLLVMAPLLVLYEVGILLAWIAGRARVRALNAVEMGV